LLDASIACAEKRYDASDIGLHRECCEIPVHLDVIIELLRDARGFGNFRNRTRRFGGELKPAFDFANLIGVLIHGLLIRCAEKFLETLQFRDNRIQNAAALAHAMRAHLRCGAAAEQPFKDDLRIQFHWQRGDALDFFAMVIATIITLRAQDI